ncbi:MAG: aspartyl/asparaginyl beta-hydroxylase domain-containing protein [Roseobacter sp.]|jgi:hypothetical protein|nr:aspartyl/asparaginyl beta-hydroxylase domain-containing protein [Roseobacter sp.]
MTLSRARLRALSEARKRPEARRLGQLDAAMQRVLLDFYDAHRDRNILESALESRRDRELDVEGVAYLSEAYAQIELQGLKPGGDPGIREDYTDDLAPPLMARLMSMVGSCYRSRISTLQPGGVIPQHVDDPSQIRVISVLRGSHHFVLLGRDGARDIPMRLGELWYVNTAWPHSVENPGKVDRVALLLNLDQLGFSHA